MVALFDNEEVGSLTRQGARGGLLESVVTRVATARNKKESPPDMRTLFANSIILSADVNHLFNPNFKDVYMKNHSPKPNVGITLSLDPNGHMATDAVGVTFVEELGRKNDDKIQYFQIKNNSRSGGTIGPFLASQTGARTIDLGIAQLSMHSIRAVSYTHLDVYKRQDMVFCRYYCTHHQAIKAFKPFYIFFLVNISGNGPFWIRISQFTIEKSLISVVSNSHICLFSIFGLSFCMSVRCTNPAVIMFFMSVVSNPLSVISNF